MGIIGVWSSHSLSSNMRLPNTVELPHPYPRTCLSALRVFAPTPHTLLGLPLLSIRARASRAPGGCDRDASCGTYITTADPFPLVSAREPQDPTVLFCAVLCSLLVTHSPCLGSQSTSAGEAEALTWLSVSLVVSISCTLLLNQYLLS